LGREERPGMLLCLVTRGGVVDLAGEEALEAAQDLEVAQALCASSGGRGPSSASSWLIA
jgi:hypothetical protein